MANVDAPFGLRPTRTAWGAPYSGSANSYFATGATGAIFIGDPILLDGTGNTAEAQGHAVGTLTGCTVGVAGDTNDIHGVCVAVLPVTRDSTTHREDSTDRIIQVADDPNLIFEVQTDTASTDWAVTDIGSYANLLTGTGSTVTGLSGMTGDTTDGPDAADVSNQLLIVRASSRIGNAVGEFGVWEVLINRHGFGKDGSDTVGRFTAV